MADNDTYRKELPISNFSYATKRLIKTRLLNKFFLQVYEPFFTLNLIKG